MKKQLTWFSILILIIAAALAFTAFTPQEKNKNNQKEQQQKKDKNNKNDNRDKTDVNVKKDKNDVNDNRGNNDVNDNRDKNEDKTNKGNRDKNGWDVDRNTWNRETFKDRRKIKNQEKVAICHKYNRDNESAVTIRVSSNAVKAHMNHGDVMGECPAVTNTRYSNIFLRKRNDYYNNLYESQEQVVYSQSILDYALVRLADSRLQLIQFQNSNLPPAEIQRKQAVVVELEQNVSLLETLIGVAANLLVNKLL